MVKKGKRGCKIDTKQENVRNESKDAQSDHPPECKPTTNDAVDKKDGFKKKPAKSVTLVDNIRSNVVVQHKREDKSKKQKDSKCLRGILKSRTDSSSVSNVDNTYVPPAAYNTYENTVDTFPNACPKYFGIKSYIDSFYYPPDSDVLNSGEFVQDDFEFVVEPGKRRWRNCWFKVGLWSGINLLLLGIIALLVGHLTPPRETIVARVDNLEILDRSAITFNSRLHLCRLSGVTIFCIGGIVLMLTLLISSYQQDDTYYVVNTAFLPDTFTRMQSPFNQKFWASRIPLYGTVKPVQPR